MHTAHGLDPSIFQVWIWPSQKGVQMSIEAACIECNYDYPYEASDLMPLLPPLVTRTRGGAHTAHSTQHKRVAEHAPGSTTWVSAVRVRADTNELGKCT